MRLERCIEKFNCAESWPHQPSVCYIEINGILGHAIPIGSVRDLETVLYKIKTPYI